MHNRPQVYRRGDPVLGVRLQTARRASGYRSAREACVSYGWSEPQYRSHEAGTRRPGPASLAAYAAAFQVDQDWLTSGRGEGPEIDHLRLAQLEIRMQMGLRASGLPETARRLRLARRLAGYRSASAAATAHGWNRSSYHAHETGQSGLSSEACQSYAAAYGIKADWLRTGELPTGLPPAVEARLPDLLALYEMPEPLVQEHLPQVPDLPRTPKGWPVGHSGFKLPSKEEASDGTTLLDRTHAPQPEESAWIGEYEIEALRAIGAKDSDIRLWPPSRHFAFPRLYVRKVLRADPDTTIIAIATHDEPRLALRKGDRLIIDTAPRVVSAGDQLVAVMHSESRLVVLDRGALVDLKDRLADLGHAGEAQIATLIGRYCGRLQAA